MPPLRSRPPRRRSALPAARRSPTAAPARPADGRGTSGPPARLPRDARRSHARRWRGRASPRLARAPRSSLFAYPLIVPCSTTLPSSASRAAWNVEPSSRSRAGIVASQVRPGRLAGPVHPLLLGPPEEEQVRPGVDDRPAAVLGVVEVADHLDDPVRQRTADERRRRPQSEHAVAVVAGGEQTEHRARPEQEAEVVRRRLGRPRPEQVGDDGRPARALPPARAARRRSRPSRGDR